MNIPAVSFIEMALDVIKTLSSSSGLADLNKELKELKSLGLQRRNDLKTSLKGKTDFERGYILGLETARIMVQTMPAAVLAKIEL